MLNGDAYENGIFMKRVAVRRCIAIASGKQEIDAN